MKPRTLILMGVAVVCGLVASYLTSRMLAQQTAAQETPKIAVLVAKQKIPMGTQLKEPEKYFVVKEFPSGTEPKRAFKSLDEVKDRRLNKTISAEVFITPDDLMSKQDEAMAGIITVGMRGFGMSVKSDTSVAGFVLPLMRVDVLGTIRTDKGPMAKTLLQNVLVLGVDQNLDRGDGKTSMPSSTVTLQVKPQEAERLTAALSTGDLRLILRGQDDNTMVKTIGVRPSDLTKDGSGYADPQGDGGLEPEVPETGTGTKVATALPEVPAATAGPEKVVPAAPVETTSKHVMTILNGPNPSRHVTVLDKSGKPIDTEIQKNTPEAAPPQKPEIKEEKPEGKGDKPEATEPVEEVK